MLWQPLCVCVSFGSCESILLYLNGMVPNLLMQRKSVRFVLKRKLENIKTKNET